jgi:hypothetical protein
MRDGEESAWGGGPGDREFRYRWMDMLATADVSDSCYRLIMTMAQRFAIYEGHVFEFNTPTLAQVTGMSTRTVERRLEEGRTSGWILQRRRGQNMNGGASGSLYELTIPTDARWPTFMAATNPRQEWRHEDRQQEIQPDDAPPQPATPDAQPANLCSQPATSGGIDRSTDTSTARSTPPSPDHDGSTAAGGTGSPFTRPSDLGLVFDGTYEPEADEQPNAWERARAGEPPKLPSS